MFELEFELEENNWSYLLLMVPDLEMSGIPPAFHGGGGGGDYTLSEHLRHFNA